ncbi:MAG: IS110 family transposase [Nitrospirae bacterium]|nr:MAG: IS110 family transposase [Nitrospirota bacterium]
MKGGVLTMAENAKLIIGVDVSKHTLAVTALKGSDAVMFEVSNDTERFHKAVSRRFSVRATEVVVVMEATGVYHLKLACRLHKKGYKVAVVNPFVIKKYAEMKLKRVKTDKVDSRLIAEYGRDNLRQLRLFEPKDEAVYRLEAKVKILEDLEESLRRLKNQEEAMRHYPLEEVLTWHYEEVMDKIKEQVEKVKAEIKEIIREHFQREYKLLTSIPSVGDKFSLIVIGLLNCFEGFEGVKKVVSYVGISPQPWQSGKRQKRGKMSKKGNGYIRRVLYMCAMSASRHNEECRQLYRRLLSKGKGKRAALIAVANKLLRQAYGVLKNDMEYVANFHLHRRSPCGA